MTHDTMHRLADALDRDDFETLPTLLEPAATYDAGVYRAGDGILRGRDAIVAEFRRNSAWGHANIDVVEFRHRIADDDPATIHFTDVLTHRGETFVHEMSMHVRLSPRGLVEHLRLDYPPDELARLDEFFARTGIG